MLKKAKSIEFQRHFAEFIMFGMDALDLLDILSMSLVDLFFSRLLSLLIDLAFDTLAHNSEEVSIKRHQDTRLLVPENNPWEFEFVKPQSDFFEISEGPEVFVFIDSKNWIYSVVVLKCIFNESFSVFQVNSQLILNCNCCFFESSWNQADIGALFHQFFEVFGIDSLDSPQSDDQSSKWQIQHESTCQTNHILHGPIIEIHEGKYASRQNSVRMESKKALLFISYILFIDYFHLSERFSRLNDGIDEFNIFVTFLNSGLESAEHSIKQQNLEVESEDAIKHVECGEIPDEVAELEIGHTHNMLVLAEIRGLLCLPAH